MPTEALISGRFAQFRVAEAAIGRLSTHPALSAQTLELVEPINADVVHHRPSEPGDRSLLRRHLLLVAFGLGTGIAAWFLLINSSLGSFGVSPGYLFIVSTFFGALLGLLLCAAASVRSPGLSQLSAPAEDCAWTVIVHCHDVRQTSLARRILAEQSDSL